jgi:hypothetical protein
MERHPTDDAIFCGLLLPRLVAERIRLIEGCDCWRYEGRHDQGRPRFWINGRHIHVYHITREALDGEPIDTTIQVARHTCDNAWCVNPWHIIPGTQKENVRDMTDRERGGFAVQWKHLRHMAQMDARLEYLLASN